MSKLLQEVVVNVGELAPPQPMTEILQALARLANDQYLKVFHRREPFPLYEKLAAAGFGYLCCVIQEKHHEQATFELYIYRLTQQQRFFQQVRNAINFAESSIVSQCSC